MDKLSIPWVEKYRPTQFSNIVLDPLNRQLFENILSKNSFPNLLFYGPPGTGKTTTIINLINEYQQKYNQQNKGTVIHLNASDERGIDIIRNQIYQFVKSKNFFEVSTKFVILDEVDYMTKNAQQALKYLLQSSMYNVRYCLICNYISKIDESLKNEFICIRFNQLPKSDIFGFIKTISDTEELDLSDTAIQTIQEIYNSDIRSMINFIQLNQKSTIWNMNIITNEVWEQLYNKLKTTTDNMVLLKYIHEITIQYNIDKKNLMKQYFNYIIRTKKEEVTTDFLNIVEFLLHSSDTNMNHLITYFIEKLQKKIE
jgi:replication factor C subunit 3/5|uniref:AAA+ ATPase domain-containing protein n=1 Tax=viral metagenome TaxID=1070528 RepID=A0A6C0AS03_9ZZZZ